MSEIKVGDEVAVIREGKFVFCSVVRVEGHQMMVEFKIPDGGKCYRVLAEIEVMPAADFRAQWVPRDVAERAVEASVLRYENGIKAHDPGGFENYAIDRWEFHNVGFDAKAAGLAVLAESGGE